MKIQCDVCERAPATVICCADEAALCGKCDLDVHAANKLASKHQRLLLQCLSSKLPSCDICTENTAFIFCVEDRALICKDCDDHIHSAGRSAKHLRFLATGIKVALPSYGCSVGRDDPPFESFQRTTAINLSADQHLPVFSPNSWTVDEFLNLSDFESANEKKEQIDLGEFEWGNEEVLFEGGAAAEVPQLPSPLSAVGGKTATHCKRTRYVVSTEYDDFFTVPDL